MTDLQPKKTKQKRGKRYRLLYYQRLNEQYFWPSILTVAISIALLIWDSPKIGPYRALLILAASCCGLALVLTFLYRLRAYAVCTSDGLRIQLPFYRLQFGYSEIKATRPTELFRVFPLRKLRWPQRRFLLPILGATVLVLELEDLPHRTRWLRLWMSKYMISPEKVGLILAVRDWMGFRAELDEFRARHGRLG